MTNKYVEWKKEPQSFISNHRGLFFAFNEEQYKEGVEKVGANEDNKIVSIGGGGYILSKDYDDFNSFFENREANFRNRLANDRAFASQAFVYELNNHEYSYTGEEGDALDALGIDLDFIEKNGLSEEWKKAKRSAGGY